MHWTVTKKKLKKKTLSAPLQKNKSLFSHRLSRYPLDSYKKKTPSAPLQKNKSLRPFTNTNSYHITVPYQKKSHAFAARCMSYMADTSLDTLFKRKKRGEKRSYMADTSLDTRHPTRTQAQTETETQAHRHRQQHGCRRNMRRRPKRKRVWPPKP